MRRNTFSVFHLFCGLGGGALGFQRARFGGANFETLGGVDNDAAACKDFAALTGVPATCADVSTMTVDELRASAGDVAPDVIFASPPCKGFSGLLASARLTEEKYQRLNALVFQGLWLTLEAWREQPPKLILLENVPRIRQRGAELLHQLRTLLASYGYRTEEDLHDCGELGGLAQHRTRFLLVARHEAQVPTFLYKPRHQRVRAIGEVLAEMPLPDDPASGPLHYLPRLQWKTWVRLALIPAGGDWRALGTKADGPWRGTSRIVPWGGAGGTSVPDPRLEPGRYNNVYRVVCWDEPAVAVTAGGTPTSGGVGVADPRLADAPGRHHSKFRVEHWEEASHAVTGSDRVGSGAPSIADPRIGGKGSRPDLFGVLHWNKPAKTISGHASVSGSNCPAAVADPRLGCPPRAGVLGVNRWDEPAATVIGSADPHASQAAVADPRLPLDNERPDPPPFIIAQDGTWHRPLTTLELAVLQGLPAELSLDGKSHSRWRERIGNAVPPPTAQAIAEEMLRTLVAAQVGETFMLGGTDIWVRHEEVDHVTQ